MYADMALERLDDLKREGSYRTFVTLNRHAGRYPMATVKRDGGMYEDVQVWCSNRLSWPCLSTRRSSPRCRTPPLATALGPAAPVTSGGTHEEVALLEAEITDWFRKERALAFPTGYGSNDAALEAFSMRYIRIC